MGIVSVENNLTTLDEYYAFVNSRLSKLYDGVSNCIGTGLFGTGEVDSDEYLWGDEPNDILNRLEESDVPFRGMLISWGHNNKGHTSRKHFHLGIIMNSDPILVTNRATREGDVHYKQSIDSISPVYPDNKFTEKYLVPRKLEPLL
jgi:hypothetical protein